MNFLKNKWIKMVIFYWMSIMSWLWMDMVGNSLNWALKYVLLAMLTIILIIWFLFGTVYMILWLADLFIKINK